MEQPERPRQKSAGALLREGNILRLESLASPARASRWKINPRGKVVLVQPRVGYIDKMRSKPAMPLSLLHAASLVAGRREVVLIDQRIDPQWRSRLLQELQTEPLLVGITCYTGPSPTSASSTCTSTTCRKCSSRASS